MNQLAPYLSIIQELCCKCHVEKLHAFGSVLTTKFGAESDIDFSVRFNTSEIEDYFDNYYTLKEGLEMATGRKIDLIEEQALKNRLFINELNNTKALIYG